ncbi:MAG: cupredoxin domain-containing protein [Chloroflexota bacterium]|nr:cupredoxin domain-containing protein [Chloroflexota bacterium]
MPPPPPPPPAETRLTLVAQGTQFIPVSLSAPAGAITIVLDNRDAGTAHNVNVFSGDTSIAATAPAVGPVTETLSLGPLAPGRYRFVCDVHPQAMHGVLTVG